MSTRDPTDLSHRSDLTLSDFVLALAKTILRPGGYSRDQAEAARALESVHKNFTDLMAHRGAELSFELSAPPESPEGHDLLIDDGQNQQFLSQILTQGIAETFVARLVEYFVSQGLCGLVLKRGMNKRDLETFLERRTHHEKDRSPSIIESVITDLDEAGVASVIVIPDRDRPQGLPPNVTWRAELLLARLAREADVLPRASAVWNEDQLDLARRSFEGIFSRKHVLETVFAVAVHLPKVISAENLLAAADDALLGSLSGGALPKLALRLADPNPDASTLEVARTHALIQRLVGLLLESGTTDALSALVNLRETGLVQEGALNDTQRRLMRATALARACLSSLDLVRQMMEHSDEPDPFSSAIEDVELASVGLIQRKEWRLGTALAGILRAYADSEASGPESASDMARGALHRLGESEVAKRVHRTLISPRESNARAQEMLELLEPAERAKILKQVLRDTPEVSLRQWTVEQLTQVSPRVPGFIAEAIGQPGIQQGLLRNLFTIVQATGDASSFEAVERHLGNSKAQLRADALAALAALDVNRAIPAVQRALDDSSADVRRIAIGALGGAEVLEGETVERLVGVSADTSEDELLRAQALESLGAIASRPANEAHRERTRQRLREVIEDKHGGAFRRFKRIASSRKPPPTPVLVAAVRGLGAIGTAEDLKLLKTCRSDDQPDVQAAAERSMQALATRGEA